MHLIWENLIPNLIQFWTADFKELDHQGQGYVIEPRVWNEIGAATAACKISIPSAFGAPVPNIATQRGQMTSEMYSNWTLFIAPFVLHGRFKNEVYYKHFMNLVHLLKLCLSLETSWQDLDSIEQGFETWVSDYERLYYQNNPARLSACPLTIHALLHVAWGIRVAGPVWTYWAFPMERHCNSLLPAIGSRRHPYASIAAFVSASAQLDQIRLRYDLHQALCLTPEEKMYTETLIHDSYPLYKLCPPRRMEIIPPLILGKIYAALATRFGVTKGIVQAVLQLDQPVSQYGNAFRLENGDCMVAADLVNTREDTRDASYIKYVQLVDKFARQRNRRPEFVPVVFYGQLKRIIILQIPASVELDQESPSTAILVVVDSLKTIKQGNLDYSVKQGPLEVVDLSTVKCVVGRVNDRGRWGIVDRNESAAITLD
ncbi:hypothetical protein AGABI1DRAFT_95753 [Agaricus bisporus var. burnettii JB137-S8]|uniref:Uncharacterized protein n=1 Tax=Agaricus bisporus var. burnettii (strain JB137-S8 / ATCC MYA-4627 / FGSC 10392) TaxID=597362 RepID=K5WUN4_AGABU|nr:uncharacterized protein AGABI1DRAFT_95753 [Agaricus bisporus var. burnettii JB137-S8]EKM74272.1 hypothetical protein AGABI1DRAFT_95753 [Agaricus bisporus var. burnettii JB137-S8]